MKPNEEQGFLTKIIRLEKREITVKMVYSTQNAIQSCGEKRNEYWY